MPSHNIVDKGAVAADMKAQLASMQSQLATDTPAPSRNPVIARQAAAPRANPVVRQAEPEAPVAVDATVPVIETPAAAPKANGSPKSWIEHLKETSPEGIRVRHMRRELNIPVEQVSGYITKGLMADDLDRKKAELKDAIEKAKRQEALEAWAKDHPAQARAMAQIYETGMLPSAAPTRATQPSGDADHEFEEPDTNGNAALRNHVAQLEQQLAAQRNRLEEYVRSTSQREQVRTFSAQIEEAIDSNPYLRQIGNPDFSTRVRTIAEGIAAREDLSPDQAVLAAVSEFQQMQELAAQATMRERERNQERLAVLPTGSPTPNFNTEAMKSLINMSSRKMRTEGRQGLKQMFRQFAQGQSFGG